VRKCISLRRPAKVPKAGVHDPALPFARSFAKSRVTTAARLSRAGSQLHLNRDDRGTGELLFSCWHFLCEAKKLAEGTARSIWMRSSEGRPKAAGRKRIGGIKEHELLSLLSSGHLGWRDFFTTPNTGLPIDFRSNRGLIAIFLSHFRLQFRLSLMEGFQYLEANMSPHPATERRVWPRYARRSEEWIVSPQS
jgi:hypothetical protein